MEEGIFPGYKSIGEPRELEEERRLFYVGITRAKQFLHLTCANIEQYLAQQVIMQFQDL